MSSKSLTILNKCNRSFLMFLPEGIALISLFFVFQATEKNQVDIVNYLVNTTKVNVNRVDPYGRTAKDIARFFGYKEIIDILEQSANESKEVTSL